MMLTYQQLNTCLAITNAALRAKGNEDINAIWKQLQALSSSMNYRNHSDMMIHAVQDHIAEHLAQDLDEEALAELGCCSYRTLYRKFKACIGIGIKDYQLMLRTDKAKRCLVHTNMPIADIAHECGYVEPQSFRYAWSKFEGLSPSEFRRKYK